MSDLRYPIGQFTPPLTVEPTQLQEWISSIETLPERLRIATQTLPEEILATPYRPGGWTVRQVVHHVADSHINSYVRFKWALTEDHPTIKAYNEVAWAELADGQQGPIDISLTLLAQLHARWVILLKSLTPDQLAKSFKHPHTGESIRLDQNIGVYAWHGDHHLAHVTQLLKRLNQN